MVEPNQECLSPWIAYLQEEEKREKTDPSFLPVAEELNTYLDGTICPLGVNQEKTYEQLISEMETMAEFSEVYNLLKPRWRNILGFRYGGPDGYVKTLQNVGEEFNVTRERVRIIQEKAGRRIKGGLANQEGLEDKEVEEKRRRFEGIKNLYEDLQRIAEEIAAGKIVPSLSYLEHMPRKISWQLMTAENIVLEQILSTPNWRTEDISYLLDRAYRNCHVSPESCDSTILKDAIKQSRAVDWLTKKACTLLKSNF